MERFKNIDMYGDAELLVAAASRKAFPKDTDKAMEVVAAALITLHKRSSVYYNRATFPKLDSTDATTPLNDAGFWAGFMHFGAFQCDEIAEDGTIDEHQVIFYDEDDPRFAQVQADNDMVKNFLHGSVLSAWYDEDFQAMKVQAIYKSSENNGNHREFYVFTEERVYAFDFWTS